MSRSLPGQLSDLNERCAAIEKRMDTMLADRAVALTTRLREVEKQLEGLLQKDRIIARKPISRGSAEAEKPQILKDVQEDARIEAAVQERMKAKHKPEPRLMEGE